MLLYFQVQQEAGLLIDMDSNGAVFAADENATAKAEPLPDKPAKRPRGRPRKYSKSVSNLCFYCTFCLFLGHLIFLHTFVNVKYFHAVFSLNVYFI